MSAMPKQSGLSLVELMISITLGLILMTGVMKLFISSKVVFSTQQGLSRIQETGRLAVDFMARDISEAGFYGCQRPLATDSSVKLQGLPVTPGNIENLHKDFDIGIRGYMTAGEAAVGALPHGAQKDLGINLDPIETGEVIDGNPPVTAHILVVRSANQQGLIVNAANSGSTISVFNNQPADSSGCYSGICPNSVAVVSDCYKARAFAVTDLASAGQQGLTITHPGTWGGGATPSPLDSFVAGAEVLGMNTNVYFLARGASGGISLWQRTNAGTAFELLEGVEQMRITYATLTNNNYATADNVTDWAGVWSVRIELVVRSLDDNVLNEPQPYNFAGEEVVPVDRRMRQIFTTTTAIRSRMTLN